MKQETFDPPFFMEAREVFLVNGKPVLETPTAEEYLKRLTDKGLIGKDKNSVGKCWYRAYTGKEI